MGDLFPDGHAFSITDDTRLATASFMDQFLLNRLRNTVRSVLPSFPIEPKSFEPLTTVIQSEGGEHLVAKLYRACTALIPCSDDRIREKWEADLGHEITVEQWQACCTITQTISLNDRHKLLHFKFLRRLYITPATQHKIDPSRPLQCLKCGSPHANFAHLSWSCPKLHQYWSEVHTMTSKILNLSLTPLPEIALLGYTVNFPTKLRQLAGICFLLAKREIALNWGSRSIPTTKAWLSSMVYCNTQSETYINVLSRSSRPKDIWGPFRNFLAKSKQFDTPVSSSGLVPAGIG